ncbi:MAG: YCF48-related protein, partial [Bacteroidota bacterium]|nr:YCF48-related protein [Bacteroidota bacterium]
MLALLLIFNNGVAQWRQLADFGKGLNYGVHSIYFKEFAGIPLDGFISIDYPGGSGLETDRLWKTIDGGLSWQKISYPLNTGGNYERPSSFTFKDNQEGWFCGLQGSCIMHSVDGGITWSKQIDIIPTSSLLYLNSTNRLVLAYEGGPPAYLYSTDGVSFSPVSLGNVSTIGIAFSDNKHGVMSPGPITPLGITHSLYTSDGGITWFTTPLDADQENFQPIGIKGTTTFYSLSESARTVG